MNDNIIDWNVPNWITVVLMAAIGFMLAGTVAGFVRGAFNSDQAAA